MFPLLQSLLGPVEIILFLQIPLLLLLRLPSQEFSFTPMRFLALDLNFCYELVLLYVMHIDLYQNYLIKCILFINMTFICVYSPQQLPWCLCLMDLQLVLMEIDMWLEEQMPWIYFDLESWFCFWPLTYLWLLALFMLFFFHSWMLIRQLNWPTPRDYERPVEKCVSTVIGLFPPFVVPCSSHEA